MILTVLVIIFIVAGLRFIIPLLWKLIVFIVSLVYASFFSIIKLSFLFLVVYLVISFLS